MITMLVGGLWHGASWTFVIWGALHGLFLCAERLIRQTVSSPRALATKPVNDGTLISQALLVPTIPLGSPVGQILLALLTLFLVNIIWVFFRAPTFGGAMLLLLSFPRRSRYAHEHGHREGECRYRRAPCLPLVHAEQFAVEQAKRIPWWALSMGWAGLLILVVLTQKGSSSFIYFQF